MPDFKAYLALTKPRALVMIVVTTALSYLIAIPEHADLTLLWQTCLGVAFAGGGALAVNQYMERELDSQMERTRSRPLPSGRISPRAALVFGMTTMLFGYAYLWIQVNPLCSLATIVCGVSYLLWYTPMKRKSSFSSFVGAIPGGMLPLMGWAAARDRFEIGAWVLFVILFLWQIPHALIISERHKQDYERVGMRQLPIIAPRMTTNRQMVLNVLVLIPVTLLPGLLNMTDAYYPLFALILGALLMALTASYVMRGLERDGKRLFIGLSLYLPVLLIAMCLDKPY